MILLPVYLKPVADKPFTFETELDDLPKETLKGELSLLHSMLHTCMYGTPNV